MPTVVGLLLRKQPYFALRASTEFASLWGWEWPHIGGLLEDTGYHSCWDQLAVLRTAVKDVSPGEVFGRAGLAAEVRSVLCKADLFPQWQAV